jgi:hypothetical protein
LTERNGTGGRVCVDGNAAALLPPQGGVASEISVTKLETGKVPAFVTSRAAEIDPFRGDLWLSRCGVPPVESRLPESFHELGEQGGSRGQCIFGPAHSSGHVEDEAVQAGRVLEHRQDPVARRGHGDPSRVQT